MSLPGAATESGVLYIVATPIGNLGDISQRAADVLGGVDCIAAEDTRHSQRLLQALGIQKPLLALHEHNERERCGQVIDRLKSGESIALVSDAGTPLISDPGFVLVRAARAEGLRVTPVPGPSAIITALSAAGLPTHRFTFEGFLPTKRKARADALAALKKETRTLVFYEAPHRVRETMAEISAVMGGDREVVLARELTKTFETFYSGTASEVEVLLGTDDYAERGEYVVMVAGAQAETDEAAVVDADRLLEVLLAELPVKVSAKMASEVTGLSRNELYQRALALKSNSDR
ncbi:16S rRNA (cytidine(1402)-2'-O)-methyltransferase [Marinobacter nanhaiticus D15-8W]|uniref:Ribosomal RNA small subunit methyltransferase I n=1 Tax=Marinobacter nanhaiticus D15-8W TaxID=626887 RepID=N6WZ91_9GAMM|nr:16S rRNA (cytidine(1402)-2'-O)-methyltransferase [Marinobacter nanhaiticus]ENO16871.1 16S rRNA (cytidine(1402)-2'-O)-methyltransferase [Marinobacter nanhaiticus D15-8W]BES72688.1 16S rRNA (cytidine(1402)-2'-O)-methyltransferase [Marinobacter nanhaiticus D15-8W]